jgi:nitrous oxidase accessory protein NosD
MRACIIIFSLFLSVSTLLSIELHVGADQAFTTIQDAMLTAVNGDLITVHDGTYQGRVIVDKEVHLRSVNGYEYTFVHPDTVWTPGFDIYANNVVLEGFSVYGAASAAGIAVKGAHYVEIRNNRSGWDVSHRNQMGIQFFAAPDGNHPTYNKVIGNICSWNTQGGIRVHNSHHLVEGNACEYNNHATYDGIAGITLYATNRCTVKDNICRYNDIGINYSYNSSSDNVLNNLLSNNNEYGIYAHMQNYMMYSGNTITDNEGPGMWLSGPTFCFFWSNRLSGNEEGINVRTAQYLNFHLNSFFDDVKFVMTGCSDFQFMTPVKLCYGYGVNTYKSYMGNYYNDFMGPDDDGDGLGDDTYYYQIGEYNDTKPLINHRENYNLQVWFLHEAMMYRNNELQPKTEVEIAANGGSHIWIADGPTIDGMSYPAGEMDDFTSWTGAFAVNSPVNSYDYTLEIGYSDGTNFIPGGPVANTAYTTWQYPMKFLSSESDFMIPGGNFLAMRATVNNVYDHRILGGGGWSYISAPIGSPEYDDHVNELEIPDVSISYVETPEFSYVLLEWEALPGATAYTVFSSDSPDGPYVLEATGTEISEVMWLDFAEFSEKKFYRVTAVY